MPDNHEKEPEQFLATLPPLMQRFLRYDWACMNDHSYSQTDVLDFWKWLEHEEPAARQKYERLLKPHRAKWNEYCRAGREINKATARSFRIAPKAIPGRKPEAKLAERIWTLRSEGKTAPEIQQILGAEGNCRSKEAIEAYLKTRRKKSQQ